MDTMSAENEIDSLGFEPIAIVGMGCRFSGNSSSPSKLWDMLKAEQSGQSDFPKNRLDIDGWYSSLKGRPGSLYSRGGYFLSHDDNYRDFDPSFFGISPMEATSMDPQQRKLLEVVYECFESAGKSLEDVSGTKTACFVGCFTSEYDHIHTRDPEYRIPYQSTGTGLTILSNRINYVFNLKGPSFTVDTACSSSLYALHLACQSILAGDCTAAVVGGSSLVTSVEKHIGSESLGILSPSSTCHTFDASADGFGRGDGIAALLIKRLSDAKRDGDPIRAVIRATAINSNGKGLGINHPGQEAQEAVMRKAYARAGLSFDETGYFECHGTGTPVGDPIECAAIGNVFAEGRTPENPLLIGSIKTNLGHTEGASGLAAVIKSVLCLENRCIPATIGVKQLNPNIDFRGGRLKVVRSLTPWPKKFEYRRASVNGFGYGGANAHVILDAADSFLRTTINSTVAANGDGTRCDIKTKKYLLAFSAHDEETLRRNRDAVLSSVPNYELSDIAYTLAKHRSKLQYRGFSILDSASLSTEIQENKFHVGISRKTTPSLAFVFTGQGAQWAQMCYSLIESFPSVRRTFIELEESLHKLPTRPDFSIIEVLSAPKETTTLYHSIRSPVCCTAVQVALVVLLRSWGVRPTAVVGHSAGEIASAFAAGLITGAEAVAIAYYRGLAVLNRKVEGGMLAVGLGAEEVRPFLKGQPDVIIGCYNSPKSLTLSGGERGIEEIQQLLVKDGIFARKVNTSGNAYHSHLMKPAAEEFTRLFEKVYTEMIHSPTRKTRLPRTPMYSSITGELIEMDKIPFSHWRSNLELPVLFDQAARLLLASHLTTNYLVEIGPHSALAGPIRQITTNLRLDAARLTYLPSLVRGQDGVDNMLALAGILFTAGCPIDVARVNAIETFSTNPSRELIYQPGKLLVDLPKYQWNYSGLLWKDSRWSREFRYRKHCRHDILGSREPGGSRNTHLWRNHIGLKFVPWLRDHKIGNDFIFPAAGYIAMAVEALMQVAEDQCFLTASHGYNVRGLNINSALIIPPERSVETLFNMVELPMFGGDNNKCFDFRLSSVTEDGKWSEHGGGMISLVELDNDCQEVKRLDQLNKASDGKSWYTALSTVGVEFGPTFQTISNIDLLPEKQEAVATIALHTTKQKMVAESRYAIHPTTLDGCLQLSVMAAHGTTKSVSKAFLPVCVESLTVRMPSASDYTAENATIYAQGNLHGLRSVHGQAKVFSESGSLLVDSKVSFLSLEGSLTNSEEKVSRQPYSRLVWKPDVDRLGGPFRHTIYQDDPTVVTGLEKLDFADYMELLAHKAQTLKILQLGSSSKSTRAIVKILHGDSPQPVYSQYIVASDSESDVEEAKKPFQGFKNLEFRVFDTERSAKDQKFDNKDFDLIVLSEKYDATRITIDALKNAKGMLKSNGKLLIDLGFSKFPLDTLDEILLPAGFHHDRGKIAQSQSIIICEPTQIENGESHDHDPLWLVYEEDLHPLHEEIIKIAKQCGVETSTVALRNVPKLVPKGSEIIITAELESPLITRMSSGDLAAVQHLVKNASSLLWVTNCGILAGSDPEKSLAFGLAKTFMNEQPSFRMSCFDTESQEKYFIRSAAHILDQHLRLRNEAISGNELYLAEKNGLVYISRYLPDDVENAEFERRLNHPIEPAKYQPSPSLELDFQRVGQINSFYYKEKDVQGRDLEPEEMLIEPEAFSLSEMEAKILKGQQESEFFSHESIAIVLAVGSKVVDFQPNDLVLALHPGKFDSSFIVNQDMCHKLLPEEKAEELGGVFVPTCTALHALNTLIRARRQETILIHMPGDHLLASAFLQIARLKEIQFLITHISESEKEYFLQVQKVPADYLISINSSAWMKNVQTSGGERKIGAVITTAAGSNHQDLWRCLKKNGKYLCLGGGTSIPNLSTFDRSVFAGGASFTSFDMWDIIKEGDEDVKELLYEAFQLFRSGKLNPRPSHSIFDISHIPDAISAASSVENYKRVIVKCSPDLEVPCRVTPTPLSLDSSATYLMIGCLGGLGRSITYWMIQRGARNFIYLSRSGAKNSEATALLKDLDLFPQKHGINITVQVILGDVSVYSDVVKAVSAAKTPIKGVIHAAAVFQACLFENMTVEKFNEVLSPKVQGTINLHSALLNTPLDFFVLTSSSIGIRAPATQSNYAAANAFMDSFARHRWSLGLQATSLALGMVREIGHVQENPEIEAALLHSGSYGINEAEFLTMMEQACTPRDLTRPPPTPYDPYTNAHIVTGLEKSRLGPSPTLKNIWIADLRLRHLALNSESQPQAQNSSSTAAILAEAFTAGGQSGVKNAVKDILLRRFSKLLLLPIEKLEQALSRPLADLGMDSMISSDVRALAWKEFGADVPFLKIVERGLLVEELVDLVWEKMDGKLKQGA